MNREFNGLDLSEIIFIGRSYDEYLRMFDLSEEDIRNNKILDAPAGACSFTAIASSIGADATALDIAYYHPIKKLHNKGIADILQALSGLSKVKDQYAWNYFNELESLEICRRQALNVCASHMKVNPEKYVPGVLPKLPFKNKQFDMILSAHFLFTYADRLNLDFHLESIGEFLRVVRKEVRIFPLVDLKSNKYSELESIVDYIHTQGWKTEQRTVDYEFQRKANSYLRIYKDR